MTKDAIIAKLTERLFSAEGKADELEKIVCDFSNQIKELESYLDGIQGYLNYSGHYGNTLGVLKEKTD